MTPIDPQPSDPSVSRLYQTHLAVEPPAALDAAILTVARQAIAPAHRAWWQRLHLPVAIAATGMLAVMLTLTMQRHPEEASIPPAAPPAATAPAPRPAASETSIASQSPVPSVAKEDHSDPAPATKTEVAPPAALASPIPAAPAKVALPREQPAAAPALADSARNLEARSPASLEKSAPAAASAPTPQLERQRSVAQPLEAATWLQRIRSLREQGQRDAAAREWEAFRQAYPDYPLPEDLRQRP